MGSIKESKRECEVPRVQQKLEDITISCPEGGKRALEKLKVWKRGLLTRGVCGGDNRCQNLRDQKEGSEGRKPCLLVSYRHLPLTERSWKPEAKKPTDSVLRAQRRAEKNGGGKGEGNIQVFLQ